MAMFFYDVYNGEFFMDSLQSLQIFIQIKILLSINRRHTTILFFAG
jgi:hypothetical protein